MATAARQELFDKFDPKRYLQDKAEEEWQQKALKHMSDWIHSVFSGGKIKGEKLLDVGTGPNINSVLYGEPYFNKIYLSDFSKNNRLFLEQWRRGEHTKEMRPFIERAVKLEGNRQKPEEKEGTLRNKVKEIYHCDISQSNPLYCNKKHVGQFDAVTTSWVISTTAENAEGYERAVKNIISLIKPGGYLILMDIANTGGPYYVNGVSFPGIKLKHNEMIQIIESVCIETSSILKETYTADDGMLYYAFNMVCKV